MSNLGNVGISNPEMPGLYDMGMVYNAWAVLAVAATAIGCGGGGAGRWVRREHGRIDRVVS